MDAARYSSSTHNRKSTAFEIKAEGNERFRNGKLRSALECYEEAVRIDPSEPVYYSNRSTCLFELGQYVASCEDSKQACLLYREWQRVGMLSRAEANMVVGKLLRQSARAFLCLNTREDLFAAKSLLARAIEINPEPDAELLAMHAGAVAAVEDILPTSEEGSADSFLHGDEAGILPRYRAAVVDGPSDYSCVGWEAAISALGGRIPNPADTESPLTCQTSTFGDAMEEDEGSIRLAKLPEGERTLALLFGGIGDARQLLATFRDVYHQVSSSLGSTQQQLHYSGLHLAILLNDVKAECLARAVIILKAIEELGQVLLHAASQCVPGEDMVDQATYPHHISPLELLDASNEVAEAAYRCYHLYLGAFLLPSEAEWLATLIRSLLETPKSECFGFTWLHLGSTEMEAVTTVLSRWQTLLISMSPETMARCYAAGMDVPDDMGKEKEEACHTDNEALPEDEREAQNIQEEWRTQVREYMIERIRHMSDAEIVGFPEAKGMTAEEKRAFMIEYWAHRVDTRTLDLMRHFPAAYREMAFFTETMLLPVPLEEAGRQGLLDRAKGAELHKHWRPNVTLVPCDEAAMEGALTLDCPASGRSGTSSSLSTDDSARCPIELRFCPFRCLKLLLTYQGDEHNTCQQEAYRSAATFFSEAALGLLGLAQASALHAEAYLGDVHDIGISTSGIFDRILISNVPDYTTLLPTMTHLLPLLKSHRSAVLKHSVLKFNSYFRSIAEYAHSMGLYLPDLASLPLYFGANHEYGGLWAHAIEWTRAHKLYDKETFPPSPDVQAWLTTIYLSIVMPVFRKASSRHTEIRPLTLHAFFELCYYLTVQLGLPPHNLAWLIENAIRGEVRSCGEAPDESPWPVSNTWRRNTLPHLIYTGAFALETRTLAGLWQSRLGFRLCAPSEHPIPRPADILELRVKIQTPRVFGFQLARTVGAALISPTFVMQHTDELQPLSASAPPLRPLLLNREAQKEGHVHLLSCVRWDSRRATATILLPRQDTMHMIEEDYSLMLLRTDSWVPLAPLAPLKLGERGDTSDQLAKDKAAHVSAAEGWIESLAAGRSRAQERRTAPQEVVADFPGVRQTSFEEDARLDWRTVQDQEKQTAETASGESDHLAEMDTSGSTTGWTSKRFVDMVAGLQIAGASGEVLENPPPPQKRTHT